MRLGDRADRRDRVERPREPERRARCPRSARTRSSRDRSAPPAAPSRNASRRMNMPQLAPRPPALLERPPAGPGSRSGPPSRPLSSGTARRRGSCGRGRAARAAPPARAGAGSVSPPSDSRWSTWSSSSPNGPPITKHRSRPLCRRSSRNALKPIESICSPSECSSDTNARSGSRRRICSSSRTSISSSRTWRASSFW